jgi:hypothetical protein
MDGRSGRHVLRVLPALAAIVVALAPGPASAPPPGGVTPPHILGEAHAFAATSSRAWTETTSRRPARETAPGPRPALGPDRSAYVWARTCRPGRQAVRFRREVWLPGPPSNRHSSLRGEPPFVSVGHWDPDARVIERFVVRFNGTVVLRAGRARFGTTTLDPARAGLLRAGMNTIEVIAVKSPGPCRSWNARRTRRVPFRGVWFAVGGHFEADLAVSQEGASVAWSRTPSVRLALRVRNAGPAEAPRARFWLQMDPPPGQQRFAGRIWARFGAEGAVGGCVERGPQLDALECAWPAFAPGAEGTVIVELVLIPARAFDRFEVRLSWGVGLDPAPDAPAGTIVDPEGRNDVRRDVRHVFCGELARVPECLQAPM